MKIIKMTHKAISAWRENVPHLVDDSGTIVRKLSNDEDRAVATVVRMARLKRRDVEQEMTISNGVSMKAIYVKCVCVRTGRSNDEYMVSTFVDGHQYVSGREIIAAKILAEHGECQLRHPNGTIVKIIRDPNIHRPTLKESQQTAPKPENCGCVSWGIAHPGTHYATCPWNRFAPPEEQAIAAPTDAELSHLPEAALASLARHMGGSNGGSTSQAIGGPSVSDSISVTGVTVSRPDPKYVVVESEPLDPPASCRNGCLDWALPSGKVIVEGQHHPMCVMAQRWAIKTEKTASRWLVDLRNGNKVRRATDQEIGMGDISQKKTGSAIIHVDDVPYAVLLESEMNEATA